MAIIISITVKGRMLNTNEHEKSCGHNFKR